MIEPQPSQYIFGLRIDEPMTMATDLLVAVVCYYAFWRLSKRKVMGKTHTFFRFYFLLMGVAMTLGGIIGHGFLYAFGFSWKLPGWAISMLSMALIERSSIEYARPLVKARVGNFFLILNLIELVTVMSITMITLNFKWVEFHSGYGLLGIVLPFHAYCYYRTRDPGSRIIMIAVAIASVAALVFMTKLSLHTWFNYLDISHVLLAIGAYFFYRGAMLLDGTGS